VLCVDDGEVSAGGSDQRQVLGDLKVLGVGAWRDQDPVTIRRGIDRSLDRAEGILRPAGSRGAARRVLIDVPIVQEAAGQSERR
jgi:hypothetical protein